MSAPKNDRKKQVQVMEMPAVRTTIVGGRPPGSGQAIGLVPRGIEVLVKKASVDAAFKATLLATRSKAADEIGLLLDATEAAMLDMVSAEQLKAIIAATRVDEARKPAFLGKAAAVMLVALGASSLASNAQVVRVAGIVQTETPTSQPTTSAPATQASGPTTNNGVEVPINIAPTRGLRLGTLQGIRPQPVTTEPATQASQPTATTQASQPTVNNNGVDVPVNVPVVKGIRMLPAGIRPIGEVPPQPPVSTQPFTYPAVSADEVNKLVPQMDSDDFKVRDDAQSKLKALGVGAVPLLRDKLAKETLSLEVQTRIKAVMAELEATTQPVTPQPRRYGGGAVVAGVRLNTK